MGREEGRGKGLCSTRPEQNGWRGQQRAIRPSLSLTHTGQPSICQEASQGYTLAY